MDRDRDRVPSLSACGVADMADVDLCKRHNEALAPLDSEAGLFFSILTKALIDLDRKTLSRKPIFHLVSGDALELWMLKVACGLYFAVGSKDDVKVAKKHTIDLQKVRRAFFECEWEARAGLYFRATSLSQRRGTLGSARLFMKTISVLPAPLSRC
jgi:hypothetical protein